jgi:hypothetical protein
MTTEPAIITREPAHRFRWGMFMIFIAVIPMFAASKLGHAVILTTGGTTSLRFDHLSIALTSLASSALLLSAFVIGSAPMGWIRLFALLPAFLGVIVGLGSIDAARQHVTIAPDRLVVPQRGLFNRDYLELKYANLLVVIHYPEQAEVQFFLKSGQSITIPRGDLVNAAIPIIAKSLHDHSVNYVDGD